MVHSTARRRNALDSLTRIVREPMLLVTILAIFYFLIVFVVLPIFQVFKTSLMVNKRFDIANYIAVFSKDYFVTPFLNSILLGAVTACSSTLMGFVFAYAITRTPLPFKRFFRLTATFPVISPPFVVALAAILLLGRRGVLTPYLSALIGEYTIYGLGGLVLVETIAYGPTAFLVLFPDPTNYLWSIIVAQLFFIPMGILCLVGCWTVRPDYRRVKEMLARRAEELKARSIAK